MSCTDVQREIAAESGAPEVRAHVETCQVCREFDEQIASDRVLLKSFDPPAAAALGEVRRNVMAQVAREQRRRAWLWPAFATATAACLLLIWAATMRNLANEPIPLPKPVLAIATPPPNWQVHAVARRRVVRSVVHKAVRGPHPAPLLAQSSEPLTIKMFTKDPNIVVIWLVDQKKGSL